MEDPNLIACLYPLDDTPGLDNALRAIRMTENESRRFEPLNEDRSRAPSQSREDEAAGGGGDDDDDNGQESEEANKAAGYEYSPGLELRFDRGAKNRAGFVFGTSPKCDIALPRRDTLKTLGHYQCAVIFDQVGRLILRDLRESGNKKDGTAVTYNGKGGQKRRGFTWILSGHEFTDCNQPIIITLHDNLKFHIFVAPHDITSALYQENVAQFRRGPVVPVDDLSFGGLGFQSMDSTPALSGAQTPSQDAILLDNGELGRGGQAVVTRVWNVSTGLEYASKEPLKKTFWKRLRREIELLAQIHHPHIVELIPQWSTSTPVPRLVLEYFPLGSLEDQHKQEKISTEESFQVLWQGLLGLRYLHEREEPIVHRDIKPSNILVQSRTPALHVKLADFGLSKEEQDYLATYCGTRLYVAPEVYRRERYHAAVDIWSLGVVFFQYSHGHPELDESNKFDGVKWTSDIIQDLEAKAEASHCPLLDFLSRAMLVPKSKLRYSASKCYHEAQHLDISQCHCSTPAPTPASYDQEDKTTVVYNPAVAQGGGLPTSQRHYAKEDEDGGDQQTVLYQGTEIATISTDNGRRARSGAPPPESDMVTRNSKRRSGRVSKPSSSSSKRRAKRRGGQPREIQGEVEYFYDQFPDPLHPLLVGSSLAAWGEGSDWSEATSQVTQNSNSRCAEAEVGDGPEPSGLSDGPGWVEPWQNDLQPGTPGAETQGYGFGSYFQGDDGSAEDAPVPNDMQNWRREEQIGGVGWTESEVQMAAALMYAVRQV